MFRNPPIHITIIYYNPATHLHCASALGESPAHIKEKEGSAGVNEKQPAWKLNSNVND